MLFLIIIFIAIVNSEKAIQYDENFKYCKKTTELVDIFDECLNLNESFRHICMNDLKIWKETNLVEDEFYQFNYDKDLILYHLQNKTFYKPYCANVSRIYIMQSNNICTKDFLVYFFANNEKQLAYLTINGILRDRSIEILCLNYLKYYFIKDMRLIRFQNLISIDITNSSAQQIFNMNKIAENMLIELYHKYIKTHKYYEPVRDFIIAIIILVFIILSMILKRKKIHQIISR
jgi:hypothetical protein